MEYEIVHGSKRNVRNYKSLWLWNWLVGLREGNWYWVIMAMMIMSWLIVGLAPNGGFIEWLFSLFILKGAATILLSMFLGNMDDSLSTVRVSEDVITEETRGAGHDKVRDMNVGKSWRDTFPPRVREVMERNNWVIGKSLGEDPNNPDWLIVNIPNYEVWDDVVFSDVATTIDARDNESEVHILDRRNWCYFEYPLRRVRKSAVRLS